MDLARGKMEEKLKAAFLQFQQDSSNHFLVTLRRKRAEQIRALLSNSDEIDLETFNREVWVNQSATYLQGKRINFNEPSDFEKIIDDIEQAIESSELELHGNYIWGSASRVYAPKLKDDTKKLEYLRQALYILNDANLTPMQKAQQISKIYGFGNNIITGLVMLFHPTEFGLYNNEGKRILKNLGYEITNSIEAYEETLRNLKEKLYAQDFLELDLFLFMFNREHGLGAETKSISKVKEEELDIIFQPYPLSQLAADTGLAETELARWVRAIERKGQAIFYGPPGTGKTFIAEKLAQHLIGGGDGFVDLVQFHPAYAYEDFIQGLRPKARPEGGLDYPLVPGRFLEFCQKANQRQSRCVLIIDEINRANLARVFGELMYLLEYRRRQIPLAGGEKFAIPANVRLIGTMNTADRSIALVDHALRRRFAFIVLSPNYEVLRLYHRQKQTGFPVENLIELLIRLNREIADPHYAIGITFFLHQNLSAQIEDIWRMEIEPYLEEYFFDQAQKVEDFRWPAIEQKIWP
ncbi:MAG: AAA family ATPase [Anaerolineae bacterium]|nr:AAA family ATPase [Anaerolineae bacterium]